MAGAHKSLSNNKNVKEAACYVLLLTKATISGWFGDVATQACVGIHQKDQLPFGIGMAVEILPPLGDKSVVMRPGSGSSRINMRGMTYNDPAAKPSGIHTDDQKTIRCENYSEALAGDTTRFADDGLTDIQR